MDAPEWRRRLQDGERVRLYAPKGLPYFAIPIGMGFTLVFGALSVRLLLRLAFHVPFDPTDPPIAIPIGLTILLVLMDWFLLGNAMSTAVQFSDEGFYVWNWRGKQAHVEWAHVGALAWLFTRSGPAPGAPLALSTRAFLFIWQAEGAYRRPGWISIGMNSRGDLLNALAEEIIARCALTGPVERKRPLGVEVVWKRSAEGDVPPISRLY